MPRAIPSGAHVVALAEAGKALSTRDLAAQLERWSERGAPVALLLGAPDGIGNEALARAAQRWSLSPLTLPHGLARILVAEALYRAWSLLQNHPYHPACPGPGASQPLGSLKAVPLLAAGLGGFAATSYSLLNEKGFRLPRLGFAAAQRAAAPDRRAVRGASRGDRRDAGGGRGARCVRAAARGGEGGRRLAARSGRGAPS